MEACSAAHHWARELVRLGHSVRLIPPQHVKPFVKRNKMDPARRSDLRGRRQTEHALCSDQDAPSAKRAYPSPRALGLRSPADISVQYSAWIAYGIRHRRRDGHFKVRRASPADGQTTHDCPDPLLAAVAVADKTARALWAMIARGGTSKCCRSGGTTSWRSEENALACQGDAM